MAEFTVGDSIGASKGSALVLFPPTAECSLFRASSGQVPGKFREVLGRVLGRLQVGRLGQGFGDKVLESCSCRKVPGRVEAGSRGSVHSSSKVPDKVL